VSISEGADIQTETQEDRQTDRQTDTWTAWAIGSSSSTEPWSLCMSFKQRNNAS